MLFAELEIMLDSSTDLHFYLLVHLFSKSVFITHNNKKANTKETSKNKNEKDNTNDYFVCRSSIVLNASITFFKAQFSTNCSLKFILIIKFELR